MRVQGKEEFCRWLEQMTLRLRSNEHISMIAGDNKPLDVRPQKDMQDKLYLDILPRCRYSVPVEAMTRPNENVSSTTTHHHHQVDDEHQQQQEELEKTSPRENNIKRFWPTSVLRRHQTLETNHVVGDKLCENRNFNEHLKKSMMIRSPDKSPMRGKKHNKCDDVRDWRFARTHSPPCSEATSPSTVNLTNNEERPEFHMVVNSGISRARSPSSQFSSPPCDGYGSSLGGDTEEHFEEEETIVPMNGNGNNTNVFLSNNGNNNVVSAHRRNVVHHILTQPTSNGNIINGMNVTGGGGCYNNNITTTNNTHLTTNSSSGGGGVVTSSATIPSPPVMQQQQHHYSQDLLFRQGLLLVPSSVHDNHVIIVNLSDRIVRLMKGATLV